MATAPTKRMSNLSHTNVSAIGRMPCRGSGILVLLTGESLLRQRLTLLRGCFSSRNKMNQAHSKIGVDELGAGFAGARLLRIRRQHRVGYGANGKRAPKDVLRHQPHGR
jgi:hypothetical protein